MIMRKSFLSEFKNLLSNLPQKARQTNLEYASRMFGSAIGQLDKAYLFPENLEESVADVIIATAVLASVAKITAQKISAVEYKGDDPIGRLYSNRYFITRCGFMIDDAEISVECLWQVISQKSLNLNHIIALTKNKISDYGKSN